MEIIKQFLKHQKGKLYIMTARRLIKLKKEIWERLHFTLVPIELISLISYGEVDCIFLFNK